MKSFFRLLKSDANFEPVTHLRFVKILKNLFILFIFIYFLFISPWQ